jgi:hypothetical protein
MLFDVDSAGVASAVTRLKAVKKTWRASLARTPHQSIQVHHQQQHIIGYSYILKVVENADSLDFYNF